MASRGNGQKCARTKALKVFGKKCVLCGLEGYVELHHIIPISEGGTHDIENLQLLCDTCHRKTHGIRSRRPGIAEWAEVK